MIIVSQNKNAIYNFNNANCIMTRNVEENCKIMLFDNTYSAEMGDGDCIGIYKTEERAKEVLKEIITANSNFSYFKNATEEGKNYIINLLKHKYEQFAIFQMPKE